MSFIIFDGRYVKYNNKLAVSDIPGLELVRDFTSTATNLSLTPFTDAQVQTYKEELLDSGVGASDLETSRIMDLQGTDVGTVKLKIYPVAVDPYVPVMVYQRNEDGTWTKIFDQKTGSEVLPENGHFVITVTQFGPIAVMPGDDYLVNQIGVIYEQAGNDYYAAKEN